MLKRGRLRGLRKRLSRLCRSCTDTWRAAWCSTWLVSHCCYLLANSELTIWIIDENNHRAISVADTLLVLSNICPFGGGCSLVVLHARIYNSRMQNWEHSARSIPMSTFPTWNYSNRHAHIKEHTKKKQPENIFLCKFSRTCTKLIQKRIYDERILISLLDASLSDCF